MPCYQMNLINVEFLVQNIEFLLRAMDSLNMFYNYNEEQNYISIGAITIDLRRQSVECSRTDFKIINKIKRQYSREVIKEVAKKKRWIVKQVNSQKLQLKKY